MGKTYSKQDQAVFKRYCKVTEAGTILGVSVQTVRSLADKGKLPCIIDRYGDRHLPVEELRRIRRDTAARRA